MSSNIKTSINQAFRQKIDFNTVVELITTTSKVESSTTTTTTSTTASVTNGKMAYIYCSEHNCSLIIGGSSFASFLVVFSIYLILNKSGMLK
jgi:hypothetical protein